jgi:peptidyl-tRNA hydrolase
MVLVIRMDLKMSSGKIAAQVCSAWYHYNNTTCSFSVVTHVWLHIDWHGGITRRRSKIGRGPVRQR